MENHRTDVGRRIALRREQLGLDRSAVAERAGVAPEYLRYLEERPASPSYASLTRVARALETTVAELIGGPPPSGAAPPEVSNRDALAELDEATCWELLAGHTVGRVAVATDGGPAIVPVNYALDDHTLVYRTAPETSPARAAEAEELAFEVDHLDEAQRVGWSVLLVGPARRLADPGEVSALTERLAAAGGDPAGTEPWVGGERDLWVRLTPHRVTGRRVTLV
ncbi:Nitroimidazol reductase NimA, pyridoxamine 5'-phosphate oxidase superfamily [Streptomyces zhaozhouensis]|uniref:Nitroimidazol reductase NimA, pyridoxamine 5'-phosphate oxidase superfamily n=1 Tax=Streptomyces zhaozhouensis TaxID=1300267 RepID=A0A286DPR6_9ACTN|nr:pyridoxamine 5'-phosphate oxidase family protein [Streptomyces zhaozhouensis]SOD60629.1 Nitroimidazol reductase NimA, pyridoxamine 5'-phosphate oxidase superfamily [Streptomyces zhaozhouensis]